MSDKAEIRNSLQNSAAQKRSASRAAGKIAEMLRRHEKYRKAERIFAGPAAVLAQIRCNALVDGKELVMPGPGLREGFYVCKPYTIPFSELSYAVSMKGAAQYGRRLTNAELAGMPVDILLTDALAVDKSGGVLHDGHGFFDLTCAIFAHLGAVSAQTSLIAVIEAEQLHDAVLPQDAWDVKVDAILTAAGLIEVQREHFAIPAISWDNLTLDRIRRISPLWKIYSAAGMDERRGR